MRLLERHGQAKRRRESRRRAPFWDRL